VHGQVVVCPGVNDGAVLTDTFAGILDEYPGLTTIGVVPLGLSRYSNEAEMRPHTVAEAAAVCDAVEQWQGVFSSVLGRPMVFAADEYYLLANRPFPPASAYKGFPQHENGIGMVRAFEAAFGAISTRRSASATASSPPLTARRPRLPGRTGAWAAYGHAPRGDAAPITVVTGAYGARVLSPLVDAHPRTDVRILEVANDFFGGNIGVAGLLTGADLARALAAEPEGERYLLPDVCLSQGRFLDGTTLADLPRTVEVIPSDGASLRAVLDGRPLPAQHPTRPPSNGPPPTRRIASRSPSSRRVRHEPPRRSHQPDLPTVVLAGRPTSASPRS